MTNITITNEEGDTKIITETNYADYDNLFRVVKRVEWDYNGSHYSCENSYQFYPIFPLQKIIILYPDEHAEFPHPGNLVIYHPDKSVDKIVRVPSFINEIVIKTRINPLNGPEGFSYLKELIQIEDQPHLVTGISTYAYMGSRMGHCTMIEERALNIETGQFHPQWNKGPLYW